jgi:hypothetical protein
MLNSAQLLFAAGIVGIGAYFVINSTSNNSSDCSGIEAINPFCYVQSLLGSAENEVNTVLIIVGLVIVLVVGLLAFGPQTGSIAGAVGKFGLG